MDGSLAVADVEAPPPTEQRRRSTMFTVSVAVVVVSAMTQVAAILSGGWLLSSQFAVISGLILILTGIAGAIVSRLQNPWYAGVLLYGFFAGVLGLVRCQLALDIDEIPCF